MTLQNHWEESYYKEDKRAFKKERKIASKTDRSKYKKTDREKVVPKTELHANIKRTKESFEKGRVVSITTKGILVETQGKEIVCSLRGLLKKERTEEKNLVAVGDIVLLELLADQEGQIVHVEPRYSILSRADNLSRRKQQIIAVNIDQVLITASILEPGIKPFLVDRYLIAANKGGMQGVIVINKMDLLPKVTESEKELYDEFLKAYTALGLTVIPVSTQTGEGISALKEAMKNKTSVFSGQSGVGKTSLINLTCDLSLKTREIVEKTGKGAHTTTHARLIPLKEGGFCIDTPGIKSFGLWNLTKKELQSYYPEIEEIGKECYFLNCTHTHEENCAVQKALKKKKLSQVRYDSYCLLMESLDEQHLRR